MELSNEQIDRVKNYLRIKKVNYLDLEIEVLDHIISDVENLIKERALPFDTAFERVRKKWNRHFRNTSSFYFGVTYTAPKMVIDKAKKNFKKNYFMMLIAYFIPLIIFEQMNHQFSGDFQRYFNNVFQFLVLLSTLYIIYIQSINFKSKRKSTYSFIIKTQTSSIFLCLFLFLGGDFFSKDGTFNGIMIGMGIALFYLAYASHYFYKKHVETIFKYKRI